MAQYIFETDGDYVNFNGGGGLWRLARASNCIAWRFDETGDLFFDVYDQQYVVKAENIGDVVIDETPLAAASDFPDAITAVFTGIGSGGSSYLVYDSFGDFPVTGETGKVYLSKDDGGFYRWTGSIYDGIEILYAHGDNYFSVFDDGVQGVQINSFLINGSGQESELTMTPVADVKTFYEEGFDSYNRIEAAMVIHEINHQQDSFKAVVHANTTIIELAYKDLSDVVLWSIKVDKTNGAIKIIKDGFTKNLVGIDVADDYANDAAAAAADIPVGGLYHTSGAVKIRQA